MKYEARHATEPRLIPVGDLFQASEPAWLAVTSGQGEASVLNKFHDHLHHVFV